MIISTVPKAANFQNEKESSFVQFLIPTVSENHAEIEQQREPGHEALRGTISRVSLMHTRVCRQEEHK